ncbi:hypothetical protein M8C21_011444, partial [Ambrosia artemisiifolia]
IKRKIGDMFDVETKIQNDLRSQLSLSKPEKSEHKTNYEHLHNSNLQVRVVQICKSLGDKNFRVLKDYIVRCKNTIKKVCKPCINQISTATKPYIDKARETLAPYRQEALITHGKFLESTTKYHHQARTLYKDGKSLDLYNESRTQRRIYNTKPVVHISFASLPGMWESTPVNGFSKVSAMVGSRLGWIYCWS